MQNLPKIKVSTFQQQGWTFECKQSIISASNVIEQMQDDLKLQKIPDLVFGDNSFELIQSNGQVLLSFNPRDSLEYINYDYLNQNYTKNPQVNEINQNLKSIDILPNEIQVKMSEIWKDKDISAIPDVKVLDKISDHFFSSPYKGTIKDPNAYIQYTNEEIPVHNLTEKNPIIFLEQIPLWEDELGDCGTSLSEFRFRVMKDCYFGLLRHYIRVDDVVVRIFDTRIYHEFGKNYVLREFSQRENSYNELLSNGFKFTAEWLGSGHTQSYQITEFMPKKLEVKEKIFFAQ